MYQSAPATPEAAARDAAECRVVLEPNVLEHADRYEGVVLAADVAVVVLDVLDAPGEPLARSALARPHDLRVRDVECSHAHAVAACHVHRQHPPAAAGLDHALARLEAKLARHVVHFRHLRLIE